MSEILWRQAFTVAIVIIVAVLVGNSIAVLIDAVTRFYGPGVDGPILVVTVRVRRLARILRPPLQDGGLTIAVLVLITPLVCHLVTVVVQTITPLRVTRMDTGREIIAVYKGVFADHAWPRGQRWHSAISVAVQVAVFVDRTVAIVVQVVALFRRRNEDVRIGVVAIQTVVRRAGPGLASTVDFRAPVAVAVTVDKPRGAVGRPLLINLAVAIVVQTIADLWLRIARRTQGLPLVARGLPRAGAVLIAAFTGLRGNFLVSHSIAIIVETVADLSFGKRCVTGR
jgi:hypothetical protein